MSRLTYEITDENKRRLQIMRAFSTFNGQDVSMQEIINMAIEQFFVIAYNSYMENSGDNDLFRRVMTDLLPEESDL